MPSGLVSSVANNMILTIESTNMNAVLTQRKSICVPHAAVDSIINHSWICILQLMTQVLKFTVKTAAKGFATWHSMTRHAQVHLGLTFSCDQCPKQFNMKEKLTRHFRGSHGVGYRLVTLW